MAAIEITKENYEAEVLQSDKPVLLDFWASWCGPCQMVSPVIEQIGEENDSIRVGKVNVDEHRRRNSWNNTINTSLRCISHDLKWNQDLTFHVSRHTWAVLALAHGAEISEISRLLGHASTGVTERVYAEFLPDNLATVVSKLGFCFIPDMNAKQKKVVSR